MPQPKSNARRSTKRSSTAKPASGGKRAASKPKAPPPADGHDLSDMLELLTKGVVLTVDRVQEAMDDAVRRGRLTRDDAEDLVQALVDAGRKQTDDLRAEIEALVGRSIDLAGGAGRKASERLAREGDRARRVARIGSFPITRYDDLTAAQIATRLDDLSPAELRKVRDYERRHGNRKSVLAAVEKRLG
jgi:polyhydroxyalkanoate synthesis regulator phasin